MHPILKGINNIINDIPDHNELWALISNILIAR